MKIETTKKEIMNSFPKVYYLLQRTRYEISCFFNPDYYTCGKYGWNCDVYIIDNDIAVAVGYRPFGEYLPEAIENEIYKKALRVIEENKYDYNEKVKKITAIRANGFSRI